MDDEFYKWHVRTKTPLFSYTSSANGYFAKLSAGTVSEEMQKVYDNPRNQAAFELLSRHSRVCGLSPFVLAQAYLLSQPFPVIPLMTARIPEQLADFETISECVIPDEWMEQYLSL